MPAKTPSFVLSLLTLCLLALPAQANFKQSPTELRAIAERFEARNPVIHSPADSVSVDQLDWAAPAQGWSLSELASLRKAIVEDRQLIDAWAAGAFYHFVYHSQNPTPSEPVLHVRALAQNEKIIDVIFYFETLERFYQQRQVR